MSVRRRGAALLAVGATAGAVALTGLPGPAADAAGTRTMSRAVGSVNTSQLRNAVTVNGILGHERVFQRIANANGGTRASGTPGYKASADYVASTLREAGYQVSLQEFTFPFYRALAPSTVAQLTPRATSFESATLTYSGSGDVTGSVFAARGTVIPPGAPGSSPSGCSAADFDPAPTGPAVALVQRGFCDFQTKAANAQAAGYDAVLVFNEGQEGRQGLVSATLGRSFTIPVVGITYADGAALYAAAQDGGATVRVTASTEYDPNRVTYNVIADSKVGKNTGETVVVGAHLDSVIAGPGINDNGSGSAAILEIARQMARLKQTGKLQRQVRFAFWGAEELGLLGSRHYVDQLSDAQLRTIYANLNFDMLGSPNYVRFVYDGDGSSDGIAGPPGSDAIERVFTDHFAGRDLASAPTSFNGRSDYGPFIAVGVPAGGLFSGAEGIKTEAQAAVYGGTAGKAYDSCYHLACDTVNNLSTKALDELGDAAAHATAVLALSRTGLYPDQSAAARAAAQRDRLATGAARGIALPARGHDAVR